MRSIASKNAIIYSLFFFLLMPVAVVLTFTCVEIYKLITGQEPHKAFPVIGTFVLFIILYTPVTIVFGRIDRRKRVEEQQRLLSAARMLKGQYFPEGDIAFIREFALHMGLEHECPLNGETKDLITLTYQGYNMAVFEQSYNVVNLSQPTNPQIHSQTCFIAEIPGANFPAFHLEPTNINFTLTERIRRPALRDIDFASHPHFSANYVLYGHDENGIRNFFTPKVLDFYEKSSPFTTVAGGKYLLIYTHYKTIEPEVIESGLDYLLGLSKILRSR